MPVWVMLEALWVGTVSDRSQVQYGGFNSASMSGLHAGGWVLEVLVGPGWQSLHAG